MTADQIKNIHKSANDPTWFIENILNVKTMYQYQKDVISDLANFDKVAWRSGHGCGKTTTAAWAVLWFLFTFPQSKVITTASAWRQVQKQLWPEIHHWLNRASLEKIGNPQYEPLNLMIKMDDAWFATGEASDDPAKMEGFHAPYLLYVIDEGKTVPPATYEAIEGALTQGGKSLVISTPPADKAGYFYDIFSRKVPGYKLHHTSSEDSPNVSKRWIESRKQEWGEDSPVYITRVKGEFAESGESYLISLSRIEAAIDKDLPDGEIVAGLDPARFGEDKTALVVRRGMKTIRVYQWAKQDTMETVGAVKRILDEMKVNRVVVDVIGIGAGVADRLNELGYTVNEFNSAERAEDSDRFKNKRAEMWDGLRQRFINEEISIPNDETMIGQLSNLKYKYDSAGKLLVEGKEDIKKRGLKSPDCADALAMCYYPEQFFKGSIDLMFI